MPLTVHRSIPLTRCRGIACAAGVVDVVYVSDRELECGQLVEVVEEVGGPGWSECRVARAVASRIEELLGRVGVAVVLRLTSSAGSVVTTVVSGSLQRDEAIRWLLVANGGRGRAP